MLAELGPDEGWALGKNEDIEINALLKSAHSALNDAGPEADTTAPAAEPQNTGAAPADPKVSTDPKFDLSAFRSSPSPSPSSSPSSPTSKPKDLDLDLDAEAELTLQRLLDEIALDPSPSTLVSQADGDHEAGLELPSTRNLALPTPSQEEPELDPPPPYCAGTCVDEAVDDVLARRFASLSVPNTTTRAQDDEEGGDNTLRLPSVPTSIKAVNRTSNTAASPSIDETETWCIICLDDAQVKCLGCDGELYCTKCWMEGHKGPDAGFEERGHRAVAYVKGGGLKEEKKARRLVGA